MIRAGWVAAVIALACSAAEAQECGAPTAPPDLVEVNALQRPKVDPRELATLMAKNYPSSALRKGEEAGTTLSMCVDKRGRQKDVKVEKSSGIRALDKATVKVVEQLKFEPGRDADGKAIDWCDPPYEMTIAWRFRK